MATISTNPRHALGTALLLAILGVASFRMPVMAAELTDTEMRRGKILFLQCRACHSLIPGDNEGKIGPSLAGVFGRTAGSADYYDNYSSALREAGHEWNEESMNRWLQGPAAMVPGTSMVFAGVADDAQRELLVRYLEVMTKELAQ